MAVPAVDFAPSGPDLGEAIEDYQLALHAAGRSKNTQAVYTLALTYLDRYLAEQGMPGHLSSIRREHIEAWLGALRDAGKAPATVSVYYRSVKSFWRWAVDEGFVKDSPMGRMAPPLVPEKSPALLTDEQLKALIRACAPTSTQDFEGVRDTAILRLFMSTPARRGELAGLRVQDVIVHAREGYGTMTVLGKGNRWRTMPFGAKAGQAVQRYLRARKAHAMAEKSDALWLGYRGPLTGDGIMQMLQRRAAKAGIVGIHPHMFRHSFAHRWQVRRGNEADLQRLAGWRSPAMLRRYAASAADERAMQSALDMALGDEL